MNEKKCIERNYGLDLFRILLAFMVLTLHFNAGGTGKVLMSSGTVPWKYIVCGITTLCYPAVNCYVLISGYFFYKQRISLKKQIQSLTNLWLTIVFYSLVGYLGVTILFNDVAFNIRTLILRFFPVSRGKWWFFTVYFAITILAPFINIMLQNLNKKQRKALLLIFLVMSSLIPMFNNWNGHLGSNYGYSLLWFVVLYITGANIAEYVDVKLLNISKNRIVGGSAIFFMAISFLIYCSDPILSRMGVHVLLTPYNSIFVYFQAISLFILFENMSVLPFVKKIIVNISGLSLAVYMFHCQEDIESILWSKLKPWEYANDYRLIIIYIITITTLYIGSLIIEYIRCCLMSKLHITQQVVKFVDKVYSYIANKI